MLRDVISIGSQIETARRITLSDERFESRLGLAIVPLCRGTGAPLRRTQAPHGPFDFFG